MKFRVCLFCKNYNRTCCKSCTKGKGKYPSLFLENPNVSVWNALENKQILLGDVLEEKEMENRNVQHPSHYAEGRKYEPIEVIEDWQLNFCKANALKYISRAGRKDPQKETEDLEKAIWYLKKEIDFIKERSGNA